MHLTVCILCVCRLMDYIGPEGDEARALLREIRSLAINAATTHNTLTKSRYPAATTTTTTATSTRSATTQSLRSPPPQQQQQQSPRPTDRSSFGGYMDMSSSALSPSLSPTPNYNDITSSASMTYMSPYSRILRSHPTTGRPSTGAGTGRLSTGPEAAGTGVGAGAGRGGGEYSLYQSMQADDGEGDLEEELMLSPSASMYVTSKIIMYCMHNLVYSALYIVYILVGYTAVQVIHLTAIITATAAAVINACLSLILREPMMMTMTYS